MQRLKEAPAGFAPTAGAVNQVKELVRSGAAYEITYVPGSGLSVSEMPKYKIPEIEAADPAGSSLGR